MNTFIKTTSGSKFQKKVAELLNSPLLQLDDAYIKDNSKITFVANQSIVDYNNLRYAPKPKSSVQRSLLDSTIRKLSSLIDTTKPVIDLGGSKAYNQLFGFEKINYHVANLESAADYNLDLNSPNFNLNKKYSTIISLNTLLLVENIKSCLDNIINILDDQGLVILDFIGQTYWYLGPDGRHWHTFNPSQIDNLIANRLDFVIIPIGNTYLGSLNYFLKNIRSPFLKKHWRIKRLIRKSLSSLFSKVKDPCTAIHYLVIGLKK